MKERGGVHEFTYGVAFGRFFLGPMNQGPVDEHASRGTLLRQRQCLVAMTKMQMSIINHQIDSNRNAAIDNCLHTLIGFLYRTTISRRL